MKLGFAGVQLSLLALFLVLVAGPNSSLSLLAIPLIALGTILVGYEVFDRF
jgi:hypothetical protein